LAFCLAIRGIPGKVLRTLACDEDRKAHDEVYDAAGYAFSEHDESNAMRARAALILATVICGAFNINSLQISEPLMEW
jgi:hypothetical protein